VPDGAMSLGADPRLNGEPSTKEPMRELVVNTFMAREGVMQARGGARESSMTPPRMSGGGSRLL
jgi:hypothetical protein